MLFAMWPSSTFNTLPECVGFSLISNVDEALHTRVGVCLDGINEGKSLVMSTEDGEFTSCAQDDLEIYVHMFESNPFGVETGTKCLISIDKTRSVPHESDWGLTMHNGKVAAVNVQIIESSYNVVVRKKRCTLKPAEMPDGTHLSTKDTLRAVANWLDVQNAKFASKYGVKQLVWAEAQNSSRSSSGGQVRGWFRHDVSDGCKRKVCPHAMSAIEHMQNICSVNFYDDMKQNGLSYIQ